MSLSTTISNCSYTPDIFNIASTNMQTCDASTRFLKSIFGQPIDVLTAGADANTTSVHSLITLLIGHLNTGMLTLVLAIYTYMIFHGVMSSANEGKFGGREMGHFSFPIRAIVPPAMLIPIKGGFCALQFIIMYCILVGVNLANYVWHESVGDINMGYTPTTPQAINQAVAQNIGIDFVYDTVANIAKPAAGHPIPGNSVPLWDSSYAQAFMAKMTNECTTRFTEYTATCKNILGMMKKYKLGSIDFPISNGMINESTLGEYPNFTITAGSSLSNPTDGLVITGGHYTIQSQTPDPSSPTGKISQDLSKITAQAGQASPITCTSNNCSFNGAIDNAITGLIKNEVRTPPNPYVQGTGKSCAATCRASNGAPANVSSGYKLMNLTGSCPIGSTLTKQCYIQEPGGTYAPIAGEKISSSWWYGSRVYLQLNTEMANNITALAKAVQKMLVKPTSLVKFTPPKKGSPIEVYWTMHRKKMQFFQNSDETKSDMNFSLEVQDHGAINVGQIVNTQTNGELSTLSWNKMASCYAPYLSTTPQQCLQAAMGNKAQPQTITVGGSSANQAGVTLHRTGYPDNLETILKDIPVQYQNPLKILMVMNLVNKPGATPVQTYINNKDFQTYIYNIISVLQQNHLYPGTTVINGQSGVQTSGETAPVNTWINRVFQDIMGQNMPGTGTSNGGDSNEKGIFSEIYSLGNTNLSTLKSIVSNSFNTLAHAQRIGLQMINSVTYSLQMSYQHINSQLKSDREVDEGIAGAGAGASLVGGAIGSMFGASSVGTTIAVATQTALQFTMAKQMFTVGKELAWMPIAMLVLTSLFTAGVSFAVILPLTPFFLFWAGQIAWVLAVIEAMVAAPLLVLGLMIPGGHAHFGHIIPGIKMMFAVVFRPVLMVAGLLTGMILTYVLINFSSQGFQLIANAILKFAGNSNNYGAYVQNGSGMMDSGVPLTQGIVACILLFTFCSFMMLAFTKCFSTIYVIPEKVMQWVGGMADKAGEQDLQKMSQGMQQSAQQGAQAGGQTGEKSAGANQQMNQSQGQAEGTMVGGAGQSGTAIGKDMKGKDEDPETGGAVAS